MATSSILVHALGHDLSAPSNDRLPDLIAEKQNATERNLHVPFARETSKNAPMNSRDKGKRREYPW